MFSIAITGITGNMGSATLQALESASGIDCIKLLCHSKKRMKKLLKKHKKLRGKIKVIEGGITSEKAVAELVKDVGLVVNMAAVIPPRADHQPQNAVACNQTGTELIVREIEKLGDAMPALVHISSVAVYGNRCGAHRYGRVGDPLMATPFDVYSTTKIRAEFAVLESNIKKFAVLRQSAMLHPNMLSDNLSDGLMFHTVFTAPLEWVTAHDSGVLISAIAQAVAADRVPDGFWGKCFNIAGGKANRKYGIQTFDDGFAVMKAGAKDFFLPHYNAVRNFHGVWFSDGDVLDGMFGYISQTTDDYWREVFKAHPVFALGKLAPRSLVKKFVIDKLLKSTNAPAYWVKHGDEARIYAYFGGRDSYDRLKNTAWADVPPLDLAAIELGDNDEQVYYGFDFFKPDGELTQADLRSVAEAHGGELIGTFDGDMYKKLEWRTQDGEIFFAKPYTVLRGGHWHNSTYGEFVWDFDRLCKKDRVFASVWYDSHGRDEDVVYSLADDWSAHIKKIGQAQ